MHFTFGDNAHFSSASQIKRFIFECMWQYFRIYLNSVSIFCFGRPLGSWRFAADANDYVPFACFQLCRFIAHYTSYGRPLSTDFLQPKNIKSEARAFGRRMRTASVCNFISVWRAQRKMQIKREEGQTFSPEWLSEKKSCHVKIKVKKIWKCNDRGFALCEWNLSLSHAWIRPIKLILRVDHIVCLALVYRPYTVRVAAAPTRQYVALFPFTTFFCHGTKSIKLIKKKGNEIVNEVQRSPVGFDELLHGEKRDFFHCALFRLTSTSFYVNSC